MTIGDAAPPRGTVASCPRDLRRAGGRRGRPHRARCTAPGSCGSTTSGSPGCTGCSPSATSSTAADCLVVVAGMEGALPSVVGGLVGVPLVAVPTSVGYGACFGGLAALLGDAELVRPRRHGRQHRQRLRRRRVRRPGRPRAAARGRRGPTGSRPRLTTAEATVIGWVDASSGASGDMLLGALVDAGVASTCSRPPSSAVAPEPVTLRAEPVSAAGFARHPVPRRRRRRARTTAPGPTSAACSTAARLPTGVAAGRWPRSSGSAGAEAAVHGDRRRGRALPRGRRARRDRRRRRRLRRPRAPRARARCAVSPGRGRARHGSATRARRPAGAGSGRRSRCCAGRRPVGGRRRSHGRAVHADRCGAAHTAATSYGRAAADARRPSRVGAGGRDPQGQAPTCCGCWSASPRPSAIDGDRDRRCRARDQRRRPRPAAVAGRAHRAAGRRCRRRLADADPDEEGPARAHAVGAGGRVASSAAVAAPIFRQTSAIGRAATRWGKTALARRMETVVLPAGGTVRVKVAFGRTARW